MTLFYFFKIEENNNMWKNMHPKTMKVTQEMRCNKGDEGTHEKGRDEEKKRHAIIYLFHMTI